MLRHLLGVSESGGLLRDSEDGEDAQPLDLPRSLLNQPVDERGCTLLHVAARAGKAEAVCLLLQAGADPALRYGPRAQWLTMPALIWELSNYQRLVLALSWAAGVALSQPGHLCRLWEVQELNHHSLPWSGTTAGSHCLKVFPRLFVGGSECRDETTLCRAFEMK